MLGEMAAISTLAHNSAGENWTREPVSGSAADDRFGARCWEPGEKMGKRPTMRNGNDLPERSGVV